MEASQGNSWNKTGMWGMAELFSLLEEILIIGLKPCDFAAQMKISARHNINMEMPLDVE